MGILCIIQCRDIMYTVLLTCSEYLIENGIMCRKLTSICTLCTEKIITETISVILLNTKPKQESIQIISIQVLVEKRYPSSGEQHAL